MSAPLPSSSLLSPEERTDLALARERFDRLSDREIHAEEQLLKSLQLANELAAYNDRYPEQDSGHRRNLLLLERRRLVELDVVRLRDASAALEQYVAALDEVHPDWARDSG
jgi:ABC-type arginine transport system ATPase subunit